MSSSAGYSFYSEVERRALYFTLVTHRALREQMVRRRGEHLDALATLLDVRGPDRQAFIARLGDRAHRLFREPYPHRLFREVLAAANAPTSLRR